MKSTRYLQRLKSANAVVKRASPGERVISSMFGSRTSGSPGWWGANRVEQVMHFRNWAYVAIDTIACKIASIFPNMAAVVNSPKPGHTVKAGQRALFNLMGRGFGGEPYIGGQLEKTWSKPVIQGGDYRDERTWDQTKATAVSGSYVGTNGYSAAEAIGFSGGGHSFLTMGEWRGKALSVVKPHEELEPLDNDHPLRRLMENPNPVDTFFDVEYELQMFEELCGVSYEWTPKNAFGEPCERWCIPSHWVYPRTGGGQYVPFNREFADDLVWDYEIRPWGYPGYAGVMHFPPDEVIVTRWKSPLSKIDGWSKMTAGAQWIDEDEGISQSRWSQMINQARPDAVVTLGPGYEDPDEAMIERIESKFMARVQGAFNYGKPIIVPPGATFTPLSFSPGEMAYKESAEQVRDMILSLWRIPGAAVGLVKDMTYGALMGALGSLCVFALNPRLSMRGQNRTKHLASRFDEVVPAWSQSGHGGRGSGGGKYTRRIKLWYDDVVPADPQQVNSDIQLDGQLYSITPNEVRALRGRAPYRRGGDDPITQGPGGAMPLPLNSGDSLQDLAELIEPMTKPQQEADATEDMASQGISESGKPQTQNSPDEANATSTDGNRLSADDHGPTGLEPPEDINGDPRKSFGKDRLITLAAEFLEMEAAR